MLNDPTVLDIASRYDVGGCTPAQVLIAWSLQNGVVTIPKSTKMERVTENAEAVGIVLSEADMRLLDSMHEVKSLRCIELHRFQDSVRSNKPDGYKIFQFPSSLPRQLLHHHMSSQRLS